MERCLISRDEIRMDAQCKQIEIIGNPAVVFGFSGDPYFEHLGDYAAQNEVLLHELQRLPAGASYVDVGANIGVTSIMAARVVPASNVVAIEASPRNFECLKRTIEATGVANCTPVLCAVGEAEGEIGVVEGQFAAGNYVSESSAVRVPMQTLDSLLGKIGVAPPSLIKVDVEGFELEVLRGCLDIIRRFRPRFVLEFNSFALAAHRDASPRLVLDFIIEHFGEFSYSHNGAVRSVRNNEQMFEFMFINMAAHKCIDDIVFGGEL